MEDFSVSVPLHPLTGLFENHLYSTNIFGYVKVEGELGQMSESGWAAGEVGS